MKQNCAESDEQYYFKCRLFKFNAFMKTAGTTLWIYSSAYIYLYMNMFKWDDNRVVEYDAIFYFTLRYSLV